MQTTSLIIRNKIGLHARPAALFVQAAMAHQSKITVTKDGESGNAKSIISILALGVDQDDEIAIQVDGPDETEALKALIELIENNFGEPI
jgi:phosphocarrier protein